MDIYETYWLQENERLLLLRTNVTVSNQSDTAKNLEKTGSRKNSNQNPGTRKNERRERRERRETREKELKKRRVSFLVVTGSIRKIKKYASKKRF